MRERSHTSLDVERDASLPESLARFADEVSAQRYLESILWPDGIACPRCGRKDRIGQLQGSSTRTGARKCYACRKAFSVTHGTIFQSSHVPIHKWLQAIYLTRGGTRAVRASDLGQILNVSFKTAASMIERLAKASAEVRLPLSAVNARHAS